jgi:hypothetical protein
MDRLIRLFHGGEVKGNGELESMNEKLEFFSTPPVLMLCLANTERKLDGH